MGTVPTPPTFTAGSNATSTVMQAVSDSAAYSLGATTSDGSKKPLFRGTGTVAQSLATSGTAAPLLLDTEQVDYDNGHSTVTNTSRYTAQTAGYHDVAAQAAFAANTTGARVLYLAVNGAEFIGSRVETAGLVAGAVTAIQTVDTLYLNVGDYVEVWAIQTSGGALNVSTCRLAVAWRSS